MQQGEGTTEGRRRPSPAMVVAVVALVAAVGGTAVAVDKIGSNDIAKNAVRSKHIKDGQVKPGDAGLVKHARAPGEVQHNGAIPAELGPAITLQAKRGDLLMISARVSLKQVSGGDECYANLAIDGPAPNMPADSRMADHQSTGLATFYLTDNRVSGGSAGTSNPADAVPHVVPVLEAGRYVVSMTYETQTGLTTCAYSNRNLWVEQVR